MGTVRRFEIIFDMLCDELDKMVGDPWLDMKQDQNQEAKKGKS